MSSPVLGRNLRRSVAFLRGESGLSSHGLGVPVRTKDPDQFAFHPPKSVIVKENEQLHQKWETQFEQVKAFLQPARATEQAHAGADAKRRMPKQHTSKRSAASARGRRKLEPLGGRDESGTDDDDDDDGEGSDSDFVPRSADAFAWQPPRANGRKPPLLPSKKPKRR